MSTSHPVIKISDLGKKYRLGATLSRRALRDSITARLQKLFGGRKDEASVAEAVASEGKEFWALKHVTMDVNQGDVVGIIGGNGAGKSTLLKIISQITEPTCGELRIRGRVASLLEVGTGFHGELSGRENIYMNGSILGMTKAEITRRFDDIVEFSGVGQFLDTPVKRYSSGMYIRLAFAVAAHLDPEILVVDEVLAVGDVGFQKKCLGKMEGITREGKTVLFVSHNMAAISNLCTRAILLEKGRIVDRGATSSVVRRYLESAESDTAISLTDRKDRRGDGSLTVTRMVLKNGQGKKVSSFRMGEMAVIEMEYDSVQDCPHRNVRIGIPLDSGFGQRVSLLQNEIAGFSFENLPPRGIIRCNVPNLPLVAGRYHLSFCVTSNGTIADWVSKVGSFDVVAGDVFGTGRTLDSQDGIVILQQSWESESTGA